MAEGVRIFMPAATLWGTQVAVDHGGGGNTGNDFRGLPNRNRRAKTYFINVDPTGFALVSTVVWTRIQEAQSRGNIPVAMQFVHDSAVSSPPAQGFGTPGPGQEIQVARTVQIDRFGERDVTDERLTQIKQIAQGMAPKGTIARVSVRKTPDATPQGPTNGGQA